MDKSLAGELPFYTSLKVCDTPDILLKVGCEQLPMLYTQSHLRKAIQPKSENEHTHGLSVEQVKDLPNLLKEPVIVADSLNRSDSIIVVTSEFDTDDNPILASIKPNGKGRYEIEEIESNFITSFYGRNNFPVFFERLKENDNLLFCDKNKTQELFERWGEQYSELTNSLVYDSIIHQSRNISRENQDISADIFADEDIDKAKGFISDYLYSEFGNDAPDYNDLTSIGLAYTTIDNADFLKEAGVTDYEKEFEIQVDANLIDKEVITYIDGEELFSEKFDSMELMNSFLETLDFDELISIGDAGWQKIADREIDREAAAALDAHEAEFGADGSRVFPRLNETKEDALADRIDRLAYDMYRNNAESLLFPLNKEEIVNALESGNIEDITVPLANMQGLVDEDERREVFKAVREYSDRPIMLLTGQAIGEKMQDVLNRLDSGEYVKLEEIMQIPEIQLAETKKSAVPEKVIHSDEEIAAAIDKLSKYGSATVDADGKISYNGDVERGSRLDIIIGLPASGKSSAILDDISKEFKSKLIDSDEAKKMFKEFNHGWGANAVHSDSQLVEQGAFLKAVENHENIVLPKVGSDADDLIKQYLTLAEKNDYTINIHYVDLEREKSLGRMLRRFIDQGRYLEPKLIDKYNNEIDGNKIEQTYDKFKSDPQYSKYVDGMSRWDNDVNKGEKPILIEAKNLSGTYIENARTHEKGAEKDETRNGFEKSSRESSTGISALCSGEMVEKADKAAAKAGEALAKMDTSKMTTLELVKKMRPYYEEQD